MIDNNRISPEERRRQLKELLKKKKYLRILEAHNGISAIVVDDTEIVKNNKKLEFDGLWESSFTDSASKGYPDANIISIDSRCESLRYILDVSKKPLIFDGDTGGDPANFEYLVKRLENLGVSMVVIEDKIFPKRNSLDPECSQVQEEPDVFANKIKRGKEVILSSDFMIAARIESLIAGKGIKDAILRARIYLDAGADAIMIHSKDDNPSEILEFAIAYNELCKERKNRKPLICVPTTYNMISENELEKAGFNIIIYANHLLRAAHKAMRNTAEIILKFGRAFESESLCTPSYEIFKDVGLSEIRYKDKLYQKDSIQVIIPAAGADNNYDIPKSLIKIKNKSILQCQIDTLKKKNINKITLIRGYKKELFNTQGIKYFDNDNYEETYLIESLFLAEEDFKNGFLYINSDILFTEEVINKAINTHYDIVLLVDRTYKYHKHEINKRLDLVLTKNRPIDEIWQLYDVDNEVLRIGKNIKIESADYEFIGIAYFSKNGANILRKVYNACKNNWTGQFHEAKNFDNAGFTDLIQEIINHGFKVNTVEIRKGWIEINDKKDIKLAEEVI